jgi:hypothetical protein
MINCKNKTIQEVSEVINRLKQHDYTLAEIKKILIF